MRSFEPCKTCKHKETSGEMVDPCFPCLLEKRYFSYWTDDKLSWKEINRVEKEQYEKLKKELESDPDFMSLVKEITKSYEKN